MLLHAMEPPVAVTRILLCLVTDTLLLPCIRVKQFPALYLTLLPLPHVCGDRVPSSYVAITCLRFTEGVVALYFSGVPIWYSTVYW